MTKGYWVALAALGLGAWSGTAAAQEVTWRSATRPVPPVGPPALLGRPVPIARASSAALDQPRPFPPAYRDDRAAPIDPVSRAGFQTIATVPTPSAVIAASAPLAAPSQMPEHAADDPLDWAADRRLAQQPMGTGSLRKTGSWGPDPFPVQPPPDPMTKVPPPLPEVGPVFEGLAGPQGVMPRGRFYTRAEYLLWWIKDDHAPPLVTTGDPFNPNIPGALGQPDTVVLQDGKLNRGGLSGVRLTVGAWLDDCGDTAVEFNGFFLGQGSVHDRFSSAQNPVLARPFFAGNSQLNMESVEFVAFPGRSTGSVTVAAPSQLGGGGANMLCKWCCGCDYRIDGLVGLRYLNLRESLTITEDIQTLPLSQSPLNVDPFNGTRVRVVDQFSTRNQFYGGQVGVNGWKQFGRFWLEGRATVALGSTHETVAVNGFQMFPPGTPNVSPLPGGLLALNSNIGTRSQDRFTYVPELRLGMGYQLTDHVRATLGYNFLYWSSVVRPGDQIDRVLDVTRIPNFPVPANVTPLATPHPAPLINATDFWAHGLSLGLEINF